MRFWLAVSYLPPKEAIELARAADCCGYHGVTLSDHLFYARELRSAYPYSEDGSPPFDADTPWPDPWCTISAMAAVTERVRFTTNIYVAPARDVLTVAKAVSTAAVISGGRVAAGFGAGWCREEFEQTGQDFATRGRRLDDMIRTLRELWTGDWTELRPAGEVKIAPVPGGPIPVYVGGDSQAALRRATTLGDGWVGNAYPPEVAIEKAAEVRRRLEAAGRAGEPFEVILGAIAKPTPELCADLEEAGVTGLLAAPWMMAREPGLEARLSAVERFAERVFA